MFLVTFVLEEAYNRLRGEGRGTRRCNECAIYLDIFGTRRKNCSRCKSHEKCLNEENRMNRKRWQIRNYGMKKETKFAARYKRGERASKEHWRVKTNDVTLFSLLQANRNDTFLGHDDDETHHHQK